MFYANFQVNTPVFYVRHCCTPANKCDFFVNCYLPWYRAYMGTFQGIWPVCYVYDNKKQAAKIRTLTA